MKRAAFSAVALAMFAFTPLPALVAGDLTDQPPQEMRVDLGSKDNDEPRFHPNELTFETGKLYRLVLHNPSKAKHYFTSAEFASRVYTRKVQVMSDPGAERKALAEIKGGIREIEVYPGATVEWWFVPLATGKFDDLHCHVRIPAKSPTYSDLNAPTIPISSRPSFRDDLARGTGPRWRLKSDAGSGRGQSFFAARERVLRMLSPASSIRCALWISRSRMASA